MQKIVDSLDLLRKRIREAEAKYARQPNSVKLVGVSKKQAIPKIVAAAEAGQLAFGETHLQEGLAKIQRLKKHELEWHFIGSIQSNKTSAIAAHFDWVHSLDRAKIALSLSEERPDHLPPLNVCIQVNLDEETSKGGVSLQELPMLAQFTAELPRIKLRGLMTIPIPQVDFDEQRKSFARLREALANLKNDDFDLDTLSMGMSNDFEAAIAEGSTLIRIGTVLFGPRGY